MQAHAFMEVVSIGPLEASPDVLRGEFQAVSARIAGRKLGILYLPPDVEPSPFLKAAVEGLGDRVIGATTGGAAFTERGHTRDGIVAGVLGGAEFDYALQVATGLSRAPTTSVRGACEPLVDAARKHVGRSPALLTLADGLAMDGGVLLDTLLRCTPPHWQLFGGAAGDDVDFSNVRVFVDEDVLNDAAVMVALFSDAPPAVAVEHGWSGIEGGRELVVTEVEGRTLLRLDGRAAAEVYCEELERLGLIDAGQHPLETTTRYELGAKTVYGELKIRGAQSISKDGSVKLAGGLPRGTVLRVVTATPEELISAARSVATRALASFEQRPVRGALVFDCAARLMHLGERYPEQTAAFSAGRSFPIVGTTVFGEFAKFGGSVEGFHNATVVMAAW